MEFLTVSSDLLQDAVTILNDDSWLYCPAPSLVKVMKNITKNDDEEEEWACQHCELANPAYLYSCRACRKPRMEHLSEIAVAIPVAFPGGLAQSHVTSERN